MKRFSQTLYALQIVTTAVVMICILSWCTNGFSTYTYESARRAGVEKTPATLSNWNLQNAVGNTVNLENFGDDLVFVDFIYTRCPTLCRTLGSRYHQLQAVIDDNNLDHITLLSISIDHEFDTPAQLTSYRKVHQGNADSWQLARPIDQSTHETMMDETGLQVIPDEWGGFAHSDSIHVIRNGKLMFIKDWNSADLEVLIHNANTATGTGES